MELSLDLMKEALATILANLKLMHDRGYTHGNIYYGTLFYDPTTGKASSSSWAYWKKDAKKYFSQGEFCQVYSRLLCTNQVKRVEACDLFALLMVYAEFHTKILG